MCIVNPRHGWPELPLPNHLHRVSRYLPRIGVIPIGGRQLTRRVRGHDKRVVIARPTSILDGLNLLADRNHGFTETVQFLQWFAFSGLDHQRACYRPTDCWSMKAIVNQSLGDIGDFNSSRSLKRPAVQNHFMRHLSSVSLVEHFVMIFESAAQIVGVENGHFRAALQAIGAQQSDVSV